MPWNHLVSKSNSEDVILPFSFTQSTLIHGYNNGIVLGFLVLWKLGGLCLTTKSQDFTHLHSEVDGGHGLFGARWNDQKSREEVTDKGSVCVQTGMQVLRLHIVSS